MAAVGGKQILNPYVVVAGKTTTSEEALAPVTTTTATPTVVWSVPLAVGEHVTAQVLFTAAETGAVQHYAAINASGARRPAGGAVLSGTAAGAETTVVNSFGNPKPALQWSIVSNALTLSVVGKAATTITWMLKPSYTKGSP